MPLGGVFKFACFISPPPPPPGPPNTPQTLCSYNQRHDRVFCLTCYDEEKRNRPGTSASFGSWGSHTHLVQTFHREAF